MCKFCNSAIRITAAYWYSDSRVVPNNPPKTSNANYCPKCGEKLKVEQKEAQPHE